MESKEAIEVLSKYIEKNSYVNISDFLEKSNIKNIKIKDLIKERKSEILGLTGFFAALTFLIWLESLGF